MYNIAEYVPCECTEAPSSTIARHKAMNKSEISQFQTRSESDVHSYSINYISVCFQERVVTILNIHFVRSVSKAKDPPQSSW